ncbi:Hypothetical predicted protein, partial [Paramuricea clavata]
MKRNVQRMKLKYLSLAKQKIGLLKRHQHWCSISVYFGRTPGTTGARAVNNVCQSNRTGASCRTRVTKHLSKEFNSLSEAEEALQIDYVGGNNFGRGGIFNTASSTPHHLTMVDEPLSPVFQSSPT